MAIEDDEMTRRFWAGGVTALVALGVGWGASAQTPTKPMAPTPLSRPALMKQLASDKDVRIGLVEQIQGLGGKPDDVLAGSAAAKPGEDVKDLWHQGATLTPRDSQIVQGEKLLGTLVVYNVFMHSLKDCLAGNFLPVAGGPGPSPYAGAGLYDMPGTEGADHPWIMEVGFELWFEAGRDSLAGQPSTSADDPARRYGVGRVGAAGRQ
jgi:hypothetical protein